MTAATLVERRRAAVRRALDPEREAILGYRPRFPTPQMLAAAGALYTTADRWNGHEGPRSLFHIAPGVLRVSRHDYARRDRSADRAPGQRAKRTHQLALAVARNLDDGVEPLFPPPPPPRQEIRAWSRKSRSRMRSTVGEIDWSVHLTRAQPPAMVTLTYPGDWLTVAPTGRASKRHLAMFKRAYLRAWGHRIRAFWKLEFQRRGAPHYHLFMVPPAGRSRRRSGPHGIVPAGLRFKVWLSLIWAMIVRHPDPEEFRKHANAGTGVDYAEGCRARDPRRIAEYFAKHAAFSAKAYQNIVPPEWQGPGDGPGRFWGYWDLRKEVVSLDLPYGDVAAISRLIRRWQHAKGDSMPTPAVRYRGGRLDPTSHTIVGLAGAQEYGTPAVTSTRRTRRRVERMRGRLGAGWVAVNDGASFASQIARWLVEVRANAPPLTEPPECHPLGNRWRIYRRRAARASPA